MASQDLNTPSRVYITVVVLAGLAVVLHSAWALSLAPVDPNWLVLAVLTLLSGSFTVRVPGIPARLSVSETFVFAAALLYGPPAATMIVVLDILVISFWLGRQTSPPRSRVVFNIASAAIAIWAASHTFFYFTQIEPLSVKPRSIVRLLPWLLLLATVYFLLNSWLVALVVGLHKRRSPLLVWRQSFLWLSLNYYSGASVAALLLPYLIQAGETAFMYVAGVFLPVLVISYLTFKTALGRIEDAHTHLSQLNKLYLSTIETLAMAIDAKDQITHGHIRRVQQYAVGLAKQLGISDSSQISAIEAASLLHDMGKLAVPEYILNKPGRLTAAEFERMKLHASIGADILSAIDFPYPVVPIVRHHHENWDGSGYPDGLRGTSIPIGARILSVVDCFDALTSDRPYRPRMTDAAAITILLERRGSMYDPLIVDTFISMQQARSSTPALDERVGPAELSLEKSNSAGSPSSPRSVTTLDEITASTEETLALYDLALGLTGHVGPAEVGDVIAKYLRRLVPASTTVFFVYESQTDELVALHASGMHSNLLIGLRIPRGERLSGWVAATRQSILNADPILDFGETIRGSEPRLRSCIATPLITGQELVGVLCLYSVEPMAFSTEHKRVLEVVGRQVSLPLQHAAAIQSQKSVTFRDRSTGLPNSRELARLFDLSLASMQPNESLSLISIDLKLVSFDQPMGLPPIERAAAKIRETLRAADLLFRSDATELVILLSHTDRVTASMVAERTRVILSSEFKVSRDTSHIVVGTATAPDDGVSLDAIIRTAKERGRRPSAGSPASIH